MELTTILQPPQEEPSIFNSAIHIKWEKQCLKVCKQVAKVQLQGVLKTLTITILAKQGPLTKVQKRETKQKMGISAL